MSYWNLASADRRLSISLTAQDDNGAITSPSSVWFNGVSFTVSGSWIASGGDQGSPFTAFSFSGEGIPVGEHPAFLSASGIMVGPGPAPVYINIVLTVASSQDGTIKKYEATLTPNAQFPCSCDHPYMVTIDFLGEGFLTLTKNPDGTLNSMATWAHDSTSNVIVTWDGTHLEWHGPHHKFIKGTQVQCVFSGAYEDNGPNLGSGNWTARQTTTKP